MTRYTFDIRIFGYELSEYLVLLFEGWLEGDTVFYVSFFMIIFIFIQVIRLYSEEYIYIWKTHCTEISGFFPGPEGRSEIAVKAYGDIFILGSFKAL